MKINSKNLRPGHLFKMSANDFGYALISKNDDSFMPRSLQTGTCMGCRKHQEVTLLGEWIVEKDGFAHYHKITETHLSGVINTQVD